MGLTQIANYVSAIRVQQVAIRRLVFAAIVGLVLKEITVSDVNLAFLNLIVQDVSQDFMV